jgi:hypothetical protein
MSATNREPDTKLVELLESLAGARQEVAVLSEQAKQLHEKALEDSGYNALKRKVELAKNAETLFYEAIQALAPLKTELPDEIKIKTFKEAVFDAPKAREWSFKNFTPALILDEKTFGKAVKEGHIPADIGKVIETKKVQVAQDLSKYL